MSVTEGILPFKLVVNETREVITSYAGLQLVLETMKAMKILELIGKNLKAKQTGRVNYRGSDYREHCQSIRKWL